MALRAPRSFGLAVAPGDFDARGRSAVLRAPARFDLLGARGEGRAGLGLEVRVRPRGRAWSPWVPLGDGHHHRPDTGTGAHASDPVWAGGADELQLRAARRPRGALQLHFVTVPAAAKRRGARASASAAVAHAAQAGRAAGDHPARRVGWRRASSRAPRRATATCRSPSSITRCRPTTTRPQDSAGIVLAMAKYHRDTNGWNDLGYNFVVDKYGQIFEGRAGGIDQAVIGAQAQGYNSHSTGIANIGTFTDVGQSDAALDALARLIAWKLPLHGAPVTGQIVLTSGGGELNRYKSGTPVTLRAHLRPPRRRRDRMPGRPRSTPSCPRCARVPRRSRRRRRSAWSG